MRVKYLIIVFGLIATLCSCNNETNVLNIGDPVKANLTIALPQEIAQERIYGDAKTAIVLDYYIYVYYIKQNGTRARSTIEYQHPLLTFPANSNQMAISLDLTFGYEYDLVFIAHAENSPYTYDLDEARLVANYTNNTHIGNDESGDIFVTIKHYDNFTESFVEKEPLILKRITSQVNLLATKEDYEHFETNALFGGSTNTSIEMKISGVCTRYNLFTNLASEYDTITFRGLVSDVIGNEATPMDTSEYRWLATNYFLTTGSSRLIKVTCTVYPQNDDQAGLVLAVPNVPVQMNYRTNIYGTFLCGEERVTVTKDASWNGTKNHGL